MSKAARKQESLTPEAVERPTVSVRKQKISVLLVTSDESLWPQIGADLSSNLILKQLDSIEELISSTPAGAPGIVLWDARNHQDPSSVLSRLNLHSTRFAIVALDNASSAGAWTLPLQHRQVIGHVGLPISGSALGKALENAQEEVNARMALLGESNAHSASAAGAEPPKQFPFKPIAILGGVIAAAVVAFLLMRGGQNKPAPQAGGPNTAVPGKAVEAKDEKIDALMEKAQQAMQDRHYIDPAAGSALSLYRDVLIIDPSNGEAQQGLQRLAEILIARVNSALDERKFDVALQSLETARSIDPSDKRLPSLDERIASLRAELGPAQIMAALNAGNFDRASQLIDEAARAKSLPAAKLAQLRDEVRKRRDDADLSRLLKLVDTRLQQDKLIDPHNDSAAYYIDQAKQAGAPPATVQALSQDLQKHLMASTQKAIDTRRFSDADRDLTELHGMGVPPAALSSLQQSLNTARSTQTSQTKPDQPQYLDLAQARLAQGKLLDPDNDSALYYLNQARNNDPRNPQLPQVTSTIQARIIDRARTALDGGDVAKTESLLQSAATLGASPDLDALNDKVRQKKAAGGDRPQVAEQSLIRVNKLEVSYPYRAMQSGVEGWVEIGYTVKPDGSVSNVHVTNSAPQNTFDQSATKAVSKLRYQPVMQDGRPTSVDTQVRVVFKIPK
jgi:TonB family protein